MIIKNDDKNNDGNKNNDDNDNGSENRMDISGLASARGPVSGSSEITGGMRRRSSTRTSTPMRQRRLVLWGTLLHGADRSTRRLMVSLPNHPTIILH